MATSIIVCPNCQHQFEPTEAIREEVKKELRIKAAEWEKQKGEEYKKKEDALLKQLQDKDTEVEKKIREEKQKLQVELQASIRKTVAGDYENQLKMLQQSVTENEEKLKTARQKELDFLQKEPSSSTAWSSCPGRRRRSITAKAHRHCIRSAAATAGRGCL